MLNRRPRGRLFLLPGDGFAQVISVSSAIELIRIDDECNREWVLKNGAREGISCLAYRHCWWDRTAPSVYTCAVASVGFAPSLRKRTSRFRFWAVAARKNCSRTELHPTQPQATESHLILEFRE